MNSEIEPIVRLNKFVAQSGICTRKEAVNLIKKGFVMVNEVTASDPFYIVQPGDQVKFKGKIITPEVKKVYVLLNKPKDMADESDEISHKPSISQLMKKKSEVTLFQALPLSNKSCGLALMTNDHELIKKFEQPSLKKIQTVYEVKLDKPISKEVMDEMAASAKNENLSIRGMAHIAGKTECDIGVDVTSGSDQQLVTLLNDAGFEIIKCDRTFFNGLTKKDLKRGWSRFLTSQEVVFLKYF